MMCGNGIRDATRLVGSNTSLWTDTLRSNATEVATVLAEISADLAVAALSLTEERDDVVEVLHRGAVGRNRLRIRGI